MTDNEQVVDFVCGAYTFGNAIQIRLCKDCAEELIEVLKAVTEEK